MKPAKKCVKLIRIFDYITFDTGQYSNVDMTHIAIYRKPAMKYQADLS